jgi:hypothetical protein
MEESILTSIKKLLGIYAEYDYFDPDITIHINSVFMVLRQLGVGPDSYFMIEDDSAKWKDFTTNIDMIQAVKTYMYLKVKLLFDPPLGGTVMDSYKQLISELEWRLHVISESEDTDTPEDAIESLPDGDEVEY